MQGIHVRQANRSRSVQFTNFSSTCVSIGITESERFFRYLYESRQFYNYVGIDLCVIFAYVWDLEVDFLDSKGFDINWISVLCQTFKKKKQ